MLFAVAMAIVGPIPGPAWTRPALIVWLLFALALTVSWAVGRPHLPALRRIDALWRDDRLAAVLFLKLLLAAVALFVLILLFIASE